MQQEKHEIWVKITLNSLSPLKKIWVFSVKNGNNEPELYLGAKIETFNNWVNQVDSLLVTLEHQNTFICVKMSRIMTLTVICSNLEQF